MTHRAARQSSRSSANSPRRVTFAATVSAPRRTPYARLALAVLKQAVDDAGHGLPVNIDDLRMWARVAGMPMYDVQQAIEAEV